MTNKKYIETLDFSGGKNSWFDLWHVHSVENGKIHKSWNSRKYYLKKLINTYKLLKNKLKKYPKDFQLFIFIDETNIFEDSVYIHTHNPNENNFPLKLNYKSNKNLKNKEFRNYINKLDFDIITAESKKGVYLYLYDKTVGIPIN